MINEIPLAVVKASRAVTLRHPNSMDCTVYRKVFKRKSPDGSSEGGIPTLGGIAVLSPEDEEEFEYQALGPGKILVLARFEGPIDLSDRLDSLPPSLNMQEAKIEPLPLDDGSVPDWAPQKYDLVGAEPGGGVLVAFEILGAVSSVGIYPYTKKFIIGARDELHDLQPWSGG
ncbi:hypothetical protein [Burkholderia gladioli]|uniref:hypothetical protein n=1 Tax=Burkholderia gladioli TaxID=28095 RepID=UPI00163F5622|nr:hypothetical protein [Burkholderia gladioli]